MSIQVDNPSSLYSFQPSYAGFCTYAGCCTPNTPKIQALVQKPCRVTALRTCCCVRPARRSALGMAAAGAVVNHCTQQKTGRVNEKLQGRRSDAIYKAQSRMAMAGTCCCMHRTCTPVGPGWHPHSREPQPRQAHEPAEPLLHSSEQVLTHHL